MHSKMAFTYCYKSDKIMRLLYQMLTFELDNENEMYKIINEYEESGWEMRSRSALTKNPINDKLNVTIEFRVR